MGATRVLQLTQPAVSQHVAALESDLGKSLVSKDSEADGSHGSGTNTVYLNCWCDRETCITSPQKLNSPNSANHHNRYAPRIFYRTNSQSITAGRSHFLHRAIWVNARVNTTTQSRKTKPCNCYSKTYLIGY
ncbi:helix-turn-helix domain-containing protein [Microcoleus sp. N9_B4]|uniref:helix-turn-helix domain-containing protein n=1 Tax=Microcoleus sp. N9_B4 TaxID=3055386 RepID=UPI004040AC4F